MKYYFAPMEGLTDRTYRRIHCEFFPGIDRYYSPFFSPTVHRSLTPREQRELPPADTLPYTLIPQILTKVPEDFLFMASVCRDLGYREINLNLGCPSGTVTAKGKGAGMLTDRDALARFLDAVFSSSPLPVSVKTRLGMDSAEDFDKLIALFNRYPIAQLTIHPRIRSQFYRGSVDMTRFSYAVSHSVNPLCYNGDLCTYAQIGQFEKAYPAVPAVMLGRALIGDPGMLCGGTDADTMQAFLNTLYQAYSVTFGSRRNAMSRMKEHWCYAICLFDDHEKLGKQLRKSNDPDTYEAVVREIFCSLTMRKTLLPDWNKN